MFALLLFFIGPVVMMRTPVDIFPDINIPVVSIVWNYAGLSPEELSDRIVLPFERNLTTTVNDIEHTESQTLKRRVGGEGIFPADGEYFAGGGAAYGDCADAGCGSIRQARRRRW